MALTSGSAFAGATSLPGIMINGSVEPRRGNRYQLCVLASENVASTTMRGDNRASKRVGDENPSTSLPKAVEKAKSLWWTPLVGASVEEFWSNLPDVKSNTELADNQTARATPMAPMGVTASVPLLEVIESAAVESKPRKSTVSFTPEKARALRKSLRESKTWHDGWYHSAIATRLAEESH